MFSSDDYLEVSVKLDPFSEEIADIICADLAELPYDSFLNEEPFLKAYIPRELYNANALKAVLSGYSQVADFKVELVPARNWNRLAEEDFKPIIVDGTVTIKAPFNENQPKTRFNIWIDPAMAFGDGAHHTTYMMMQGMLHCEDRIRSHKVLDMGCGTGILGILAAKMGAKKVFAVDIDAVAARSAWGNARWNRVGTKIETACGDASLLQMLSYDVILANIHRNILVYDMTTYYRSLTRGGTILLSGFYESDIPFVSEAALAAGFVWEETLTREGWACLRFVKPQ